VICRPARASPCCELLGVGPGKVGGQRLVGRAARGCANDQPRRVAQQRVHPDAHERLRRLTINLSRRSTLAEGGLCAYQRSGADGPTQRTPRLRLGVLDALDQRVASVTPSPGMSAVNCESAVDRRLCRRSDHRRRILRSPSDRRSHRRWNTTTLTVNAVDRPPVMEARKPETFLDLSRRLALMGVGDAKGALPQG